MSEWPKVTEAPKPEDVVQVLMTEEMARRFEERVLGNHTRGFTKLSTPMLFREDDLPTYIIDVDVAEPEQACDATVWDGPYSMPCGHVLVNGKCVRHGRRRAE